MGGLALFESGHKSVTKFVFGMVYAFRSLFEWGDQNQ